MILNNSESRKAPSFPEPSAAQPPRTEPLHLLGSVQTVPGRLGSSSGVRRRSKGSVPALPPISRHLLPTPAPGLLAASYLESAVHQEDVTDSHKPRPSRNAAHVRTSVFILDNQTWATASPGIFLLFQICVPLSMVHTYRHSCPRVEFCF